LIIYLNVKLNFDEDTSTAIYHVNELLTFFFPIFGAIIAESFCGLYKAIVIMFAVGFVGGGIVVIESFSPGSELNM
jgi:dipeptide/tripeptide permease